MDWITGEFDVVWPGAAPLGVATEISGQRDCDLADARLLDSGVLVLRMKDDGRLVYCAPHTWVTVSTPAPRQKRQTAPHRIR